MPTIALFVAPETSFCSCRGEFGISVVFNEALNCPGISCLPFSSTHANSAELQPFGILCHLSGVGLLNVKVSFGCLSERLNVAMLKAHGRKRKEQTE